MTAASGATCQLVAHGLVTGGLFFLVGMLFGVFITTAMFLWALQRILFGKPPSEWAALPRLTARELATMLPLIVLIVLLGILPGPLVGLIESALRAGPLVALAKGG
jgi:NADH-quinone oxidoreductase subunit M